MDIKIKAYKMVTGSDVKGFKHEMMHSLLPIAAAAHVMSADSKAKESGVEPDAAKAAMMSEMKMLKRKMKKLGVPLTFLHELVRQRYSSGSCL